MSFTTLLLGSLLLGQTAGPSVEFRGATLQTGSQGRINLLWYPRTNWVPAGGYRVYRIDGNRRTLIFPTTGFSFAALSTAAPYARLQPTSGLPLEALWSRTVGSPLFGSDATSASNLLTLSRPPSAAPLFHEWKQALQSPTTRLPLLKGNVKLLPNASGLRARFESVASRSERFVPRDESIGATAARRVREARQSVIQAAVIDPAYGAIVGFRVTDTVQNFANPVSYAVHGLSGTTETPIPLATVTVPPSIPTPQTLPAFEAIQTAHGRVAFRWERPTQQVEDDSGGAVTYTIQRNGTRINKKPVVIADTEDTTGELTEPVAFFVDADAPKENVFVRYQVDARDAFGRLLYSADLNVEIKNLLSPSNPDFFYGGANRTIRAFRRIVPAQAKAMLLVDLGPSKVSETSGGIASIGIERKDTEETTATWQAVPINPTECVELRRLAFQTPGVNQQDVDSDIRAAACLIFGEEKGLRMTSSELQRLRNRLVNEGGAKFFFDTTALPDRNYVYRIRFTSANGIPGDFTESSVVGIPETSPPPRVLSFTGSFAQIIGSAALTDRPSKFVARTGASARALGSREYKVAAKGPSVAGKPNPVTKKKIAIPPSVEVRSAINLDWSHTTTQRGMTFSIQRCFSSKGSLPITDGVDGIPGPGTGSWFEVAQDLKATSFTDRLPAHGKGTFNYRIVPKNRWGVKAIRTAIRIPVSSTLTPSTPEVASIKPLETGGINIEFRYPDRREDISTIKIYRMVEKNKPLLPKEMRSLLQRDKSGSNVQSLQMQSGSLPDLRAFQLASMDYKLVAEVTPGQLPIGTKGVIWKDPNPDGLNLNWYVLEAVSVLGRVSDRSTPVSSAAVKVSALPVTALTATTTPEGVRLTWTPAADSGSVMIIRSPVKVASGSLQGVTPPVTLPPGAATSAAASNQSNQLLRDFITPIGITLANGISGREFTDNTARSRRRYRYEVISVDKKGNRSTPTTVEVTVNPTE